MNFKSVPRQLVPTVFDNLTSLERLVLSTIVGLEMVGTVTELGMVNLVTLWGPMFNEADIIASFRQLEMRGLMLPQQFPSGETRLVIADQVYEAVRKRMSYGFAEQN